MIRVLHSQNSSLHLGNSDGELHKWTKNQHRGTVFNYSFNYFILLFVLFFCS